MIIGLSGPPRAGKSEYAKTLRNLGVKDLSISKTIAFHTAMYLGRTFADEEKDVAQDELGGHTPREALIHMGQMDRYRSDLWIVKTFELFYMGPKFDYVIESVGKQEQWFAVSAWINRNEKITGHFTPRTLVSVERPGVDWSDNRTPVHESDPELRHKFVNDGTLSDLQNDATELYLALRKAITR